MSKHKVQTTFMNIGASSLLVIFIVLCIAIFATLSLSSAKSDYSFSENMAQHKMDYYMACNQAEAILDQVDAVLAEAASLSAGQQEYYEKAAAMTGGEINGVAISMDEPAAKNGNIPTISWQIPIDDTQILDVQLTLNWPYDGEETGFYKISKWQTTGGKS